MAWRDFFRAKTLDSKASEPEKPAEPASAEGSNTVVSAGHPDWPPGPPVKACPVCGATCVVRLGLGGWRCNQCGASRDPASRFVTVSGFDSSGNPAVFTLDTWTGERRRAIREEADLQPRGFMEALARSFRGTQ